MIGTKTNRMLAFLVKFFWRVCQEISVNVSMFGDEESS